MIRPTTTSEGPKKRRNGAVAIVSLALIISSTVGITGAATVSTKLDFSGGGGLRNPRNLRDELPCDCTGRTVGTLLYENHNRGLLWKDVEYAIRRVTEGVRMVTLRPTTFPNGTDSRYQLYKPTLHNATECGCDHYEFSGLPDIKAPHLNMTYTVRCCRDPRYPLPHENICIMYKNKPMCGTRPPEDDSPDLAETTGICIVPEQMNWNPDELIEVCENNRRCGNPTTGGNPNCNDPGVENCCPPGEGDCFPNHCSINKKSCGVENGRGDLAMNTQTGANMCMHDVDCTHDEAICSVIDGMKCFDECGPEY